eukprot:CAMPEP_0194234654 /NCGR_PEP_ID=MMETSP0158-20130606/2341_1 /TAXON_ID=33649 /ORGANISM="Thalassionema nitzschioides, Strain L26-B" /LENGTH=216 /DNA_ID=CAMNT_0038967915 /DNA_START=163 /DNA_END=813 /DNA_ORIENTATION=-
MIRSALPVLSSTTSQPHQLQQTRNRTKTKRRKRIHEKYKKKQGLAAKGIFPAKPDKYIPKDTPVINALSREERDKQAEEATLEASRKLKERMSEVQTKPQIMRFHMEGLVMSDRVRKLFDLTNGAQSEVVRAQKERGMELFQMRDGDTGSSAVQVVALTTRIQQLEEHLKKHRKDNSSKRGLEALKVRRRKLLDYMERKEFDGYRHVVKTLGLKRR